MTPYPELDSVRIGCVKYLNAAPLIYDCGVPVHFDHPSALAVALSNGDLDVALVSVSALFSRSRRKASPLMSTFFFIATSCRCIVALTRERLKATNRPL